MRHKVIFVERPEHIKKALSFVNNDENCQIVALGANVMWQLEKKGH